MRATLNRIKQVAAIACVFAAVITSNSALAVFIDFDDLTPFPPDDPFFSDHPLSDEYISQGLAIGGGAWLYGENGENYMTIGSGGASISFVGALPTYVSMEVTSLHHDAIFLSAFNETGLFSSKRTEGWVGPFPESTPDIANELVSFSSELGISRISMGGFFNLRMEANIDNITYSYAPIPEPSSLALMALGLFAILWRSIRVRQRIVCRGLLR